MRKREKRVRTEAHRLGTDKAHHGHAAKQAAKRHNNGLKISAQALRRRQSGVARERLPMQPVRVS